MVRQKPANTVKVHEDEPEIQLSESQVESDEGDTVMDESRGPENESGATHNDESEESELDESVAEDIARFEASFKGINKRYRLINRIGEGEC
jgi:cell division control protein 7